MTASDVKRQPSDLMGRMFQVLRRLGLLYDAGQVTRLHTVPTQRRHTIAEHVYGSLLIATELVALNHLTAAEQVTTLDYATVVRALLVHDAPELETGDVPAPVKRVSPTVDEELAKLEQLFYLRADLSTPQLNELERDIVKASDTLDLGMTCLYERMLGNRHPTLDKVFRNVIEYTHGQLHVVGVREMREFLNERWVYV